MSEVKKTHAADGMKGDRREPEMESAAAQQKKTVKRWSAQRKREVVVRLLRGESLDSLSRETGVEIYRLDEWRQRALNGIDEALKERNGNDPLVAELSKAKECIGDLTMENELLREKIKKKEQSLWVK